MSDLMNEEIEKCMTTIETNLDSIFVRDQVNGKVGTYALCELPAHRAIYWAFRWIRETCSTPFPVDHATKAKPAKLRLEPLRFLRCDEVIRILGDRPYTIEDDIVSIETQDTIQYATLQTLLHKWQIR